MVDLGFLQLKDKKLQAAPIGQGSATRISGITAPTVGTQTVGLKTTQATPASLQKAQVDVNRNKIDPTTGFSAKEIDFLRQVKAQGMDKDQALQYIQSKRPQETQSSFQQFITPMAEFARGVADVGRGIETGLDKLFGVSPETQAKSKAFDEAMHQRIIGKQTKAGSFIREGGKIAGATALTAPISGLGGASLLGKTAAFAAEGVASTIPYAGAEGRLPTGKEMLFGSLAGGIPLVGAGLKAAGKGLSKIAPKLELSGLLNPAKLNTVKEKLIQEGVEQADALDVGNWMLNRGIKGDKTQIIKQLENIAKQSKSSVDDILGKSQQLYKNPTADDLLNKLAQEYDGSIAQAGRDKFNKIVKLLDKSKKEGLSLTELNEVKRMVWDLDPYTATGKVKVSKADLAGANSELKKFIEKEATNTVQGVDENMIKMLNNETQIAKGLSEGIARKESADAVREIINFMAGRSPGAIVGGTVGYQQGGDWKSTIIGALIGGAAGSTKMKTKAANTLFKMFSKPEQTVLQKFIQSGGVGKLAPKIVAKLEELRKALPYKGPLGKTPRTIVAPGETLTAGAMGTKRPGQILEGGKAKVPDMFRIIKGKPALPNLGSKEKPIALGNLKKINNVNKKGAKVLNEKIYQPKITMKAPEENPTYLKRVEQGIEMKPLLQDGKVPTRSPIKTEGDMGIVYRVAPEGSVDRVGDFYTTSKESAKSYLKNAKENGVKNAVIKETKKPLKELYIDNQVDVIWKPEANSKGLKPKSEGLVGKGEVPKTTKVNIPNLDPTLYKELSKGKKLYRGGDEYGIFRTDDADLAKSFDDNVVEKIISFKKTLEVRGIMAPKFKELRTLIEKEIPGIDLEMATNSYRRNLKELDKLKKWAKDNGYDGIIGTTSDDGMNYIGNEFIIIK